MLYLAIDQHSKQLTVNVRDEEGQVVIRKQVSTRSDAPPMPAHGRSLGQARAVARSKR